MPRRFAPRQKPGAPFRVLELTRLPDALVHSTPADPPDGWQEACIRAADQGAVKIDEDQQNELWRIVRHYTRLAYTVNARPSAADVKSRIEALTRASGHLRHEISQLDTNEVFSVRSAISELFPGDRLGGMNELDTLLIDLEMACGELLRDFERQVQGKPSREKYPGFVILVNRLAGFFEKAGGHPSAASSPAYPQHAPRRTPFVRFCWSVYQSVPPIPGLAPFSSEYAFGEAVYSALRKKGK